MATISLSRDGKKAIKEIGSLEQLCADLIKVGSQEQDTTTPDDSNDDVILYKLSLFSRLCAMTSV